MRRPKVEYTLSIPDSREVEYALESVLNALQDVEQLDFEKAVHDFSRKAIEFMDRWAEDHDIPDDGSDLAYAKDTEWKI